MPILESTYNPPFFVRGGHTNTILSRFLPRSSPKNPRLERLKTDDGDFIDIDHYEIRENRLAIITHGLEGSSRSPYIRGMCSRLLNHGFDVAAWNFRGCSGEPNLLPSSYHGGKSDDLRRVITHLEPKYETIFLVGFSMGGNITLKYLCEEPPSKQITTAVCISVPCDLEASATLLDKPSMRFYTSYFLSSLKRKIKEKASRFPDKISTKGIDHIKTFLEFDNNYTAPLHGFKDAFGYWDNASAKFYLDRLATRTLLINAEDDPFLAPSCTPKSFAASSEYLSLLSPKHGGHVGFFELSRHKWHERKVLEFFLG